MPSITFSISCEPAVRSPRAWRQTSARSANSQASSGANGNTGRLNWSLQNASSLSRLAMIALAMDRITPIKKCSVLSPQGKLREVRVRKIASCRRSAASIPAVKARQCAIRMRVEFELMSIAAIADRTCAFVRYDACALFDDVCAPLPKFGQALVDFLIFVPLLADAFAMVSSLGERDHGCGVQCRRCHFVTSNADERAPRRHGFVGWSDTKLGHRHGMLSQHAVFAIALRVDRQGLRNRCYCRKSQWLEFSPQTPDWQCPNFSSPAHI